ncbi:MAG: type II toxin-antitoxin system YafQ family toxin [Ruminococcus sp.]|nr:type II toxin-antitoxin system YafQ family toxin [Ruminococcus sp.]MDR4078168.1 type II toxin-antitoxin system YafQ family toxin [Ruminococcus sp.]
MSKLRIVPSQKFNRDVKLAIKRGYNIQLLDDVVEMIAEQQLLPPEYKDYKLIGNYSGCRELTIQINFYSLPCRLVHSANFVCIN